MKDYRVTDFDDIHCDFSRIDGTERPMLSLACSRDDGKTTGFLIRKALHAYAATALSQALLTKRMPREMGAASRGVHLPVGANLIMEIKHFYFPPYLIVMTTFPNWLTYTLSTSELRK